MKYTCRCGIPERHFIVAIYFCRYQATSMLPSQCLQYVYMSLLAHYMHIYHHVANHTPPYYTIVPYCKFFFLTTVLPNVILELFGSAIFGYLMRYRMITFLFGIWRNGNINSMSNMYHDDRFLSLEVIIL
jgi:hypothetical protein